MQVFPLNKDDVGTLMAEHGITSTPQRVEIAQVLFAKAQHLSAEQVLSRVNEDRVHVSKATVYNTLGLFARKGLIREVIVDPAKVFYDPTTVPHHHFYNVDTGSLMDIDADTVELKRLPELPQGTTAAGVDVIIRVRSRSTPGEK
jgi:Fur family transcriptional regulator, iron response regulator